MGVSRVFSYGGKTVWMLILGFVGAAIVSVMLLTRTAELRYQRESHLRLVAQVRLAEEAQNALSERRRRVAELETERARLLAENELAHGRIADLYAANERYDRDVSKARAELDRLVGILRQIYASRTWKLHLLLDRLRGRS